MADSEERIEENPAGSDASAEESGAPSGPEVIAAYVKHLGSGPGVYRMLDKAGEVIYVGKARNLKNRVQNYARMGGHTNRIAAMIRSTVAMEFVNTATEAEALLLEANLIKRFKPRYNVSFRDDKSFPYIVIRRDQEAPQIAKHRGARTLTGDYFGPFASAGAVNRTINTLQRAFLLRSCSDSVYESRTRPCLLYQIKRCSAPCTGEIPLEDYAKLVDEAETFLKGKTDAVQKKLNALMEEAAEKLEYERAAKYRNRLWALAHIQAHQGINPQGVEEADVFAIAQEGGQTCIQVFFFRCSQNWGNRAYFPRGGATLSAEEVLGSFIAQFYDDKIVPRCVLLSCGSAGASADRGGADGEARAQGRGADAEARREARAGGARRTECARGARPQAGGEFEPGQALGRCCRSVRAGAHPAPHRGLRQLAYHGHQRGRRHDRGRAGRLREEPVPQVQHQDRRPHAGRRLRHDARGAHAPVQAPAEGARACPRARLCGMTKRITPHPVPLPMGEGTPSRSRQRPHLPLPWGEGGVRGDPLEGEALCSEPVEDGIDDEAEAQGGDVGAWPDLLLIDGGAGQLSAAREVLDALGLHGLAVAGIAKGPDRNAGRERFFMPEKPPFSLAPNDPVLYFVQRLRDEAHRFAIGSHRAKRKKAISENTLDDIPGIGPARKRALLRHFGSAKSVSRAGLPDLQAVAGISEAMAQLIYDYFHGGK